MNRSLADTLVLCDLDSLLLGPDGNLTQVLRDIIQLYGSRGGRLTVFSQRTPKAVRTLLGGVRLGAPALLCGGTLAYSFAQGRSQGLCSFAGFGRLCWSWRPRCRDWASLCRWQMVRPVCCV